MSCRRIRRDLVELVRFGDLERGTVAHIDHLERCRACRDEVGLDRALVAQLRRALAARVDGAAPPSRAWNAILRETQQPEPRPWVWTWSSTLLGRMRTATAMAGTGLALVLALNMEVVGIGGSPAPSPTISAEATAEVGARGDGARSRLDLARSSVGGQTGIAVSLLNEEQILLEARTRPEPEPKPAPPDPRQHEDALIQLVIGSVAESEEQDEETEVPADVDEEAGTPAEEVQLQPGVPS